MNGGNTAIISGIGTPLAHYATEQAIPFFELAENVGGRFSVFSVVGLLPLAMVGVDIVNMLQGAQKVYESFFSQGQSYDILMKKARFIVENKHRFLDRQGRVHGRVSCDVGEEFGVYLSVPLTLP